MTDIIELDTIHSNNSMICADCGDPITLDNFTGWEVFISPGTTQAVCKFCSLVRDCIHEKSEK